MNRSASGARSSHPRPRIPLWKPSNRFCSEAECSGGVRSYPIYSCGSMVLVPYIHVLSAAFLMGLVAAAPMGPVNMLAIRRGVIGGWRHTLACGIGSITGDLILFSLTLLGGDYFFSYLSNPAIQTVLAAMGAIILLPLGIYFLVRAGKEPLRAYESARHHWDQGTAPGHLIAEVADAAALTIFNPLTIAYWICVTPNWLPFAHSVLGYSAPGLGLLTAAAGLTTWFTALTVSDRHPAPHRPELLPPRQRHARAYPLWVRYVLRNSPVPPSFALRRRVAIKTFNPHTVQ